MIFNLISSNFVKHCQHNKLKKMMIKTTLYKIQKNIFTVYQT